MKVMLREDDDDDAAAVDWFLIAFFSLLDFFLCKEGVSYKLPRD